jgi:hypothetical protein
MAKPRIFISSTFYDLRYVREDLERFIVGMGYEPVRHETGNIPYSKKGPLEEAVYKEVALSDVIVCIIGGRYGTESLYREGSITQNELLEAFNKGIQVYIFVEQSVLSEFSTYRLNKDNKDIKYGFVNNIEIYKFLEMIHSLPQNNPVAPFTTSADICDILRSQWAGLFQRFLREEGRLSEIQTLEEMKGIARTLQETVSFLTKERKDSDGAIKTILSMNHPVFRRFAEIANIRYRVFFTSKTELDLWLAARSYQPLSSEEYDPDSVAEWVNKREKKYIKLKRDIFDKEGKLKAYSEQGWENNWIELCDLPGTAPEMPPPDEIPF